MFKTKIMKDAKEALCEGTTGTTTVTTLVTRNTCMDLCSINHNWKHAPTFVLKLEKCPKIIYWHHGLMKLNANPLCTAEIIKVWLFIDHQFSTIATIRSSCWYLLLMGVTSRFTFKIPPASLFVYS